MTEGCWIKMTGHRPPANPASLSAPEGRGAGRLHSVASGDVTTPPEQSRNGQCWGSRFCGPSTSCKLWLLSCGLEQVTHLTRAPFPCL